jgi:site-specific DNA-methyltransferase (adenine-specific)
VIRRAKQQSETLRALARLVGRTHAHRVGGDALLLKGDALAVMAAARELRPDGLFDMIFADPPYLLSNNGISCHSGRMVSVNKGAWDRSRGHSDDFDFVKAMQSGGMRILNNITWEKPNPPPNLSCRYFTHSTESVLWASKNKKSKHYFDYAAMRRINGGKQMKDVWRMTAPGKTEKSLGKHPTQKPLDLLRRIVVASTPRGALILDPFAGSFTTSVAAHELGRYSVGIERSARYVKLGRKRIAAI